MPEANRSGVPTLCVGSMEASVPDAEARNDRRVRNPPKDRRRDLDLRRPAAAAEDHPVELHELVVNVDRQVGRQREHRDAADHHAGEGLRLLRGGERDRARTVWFTSSRVVALTTHTPNRLGSFFEATTIVLPARASGRLYFSQQAAVSANAGSISINSYATPRASRAWTTRSSIIMAGSA